MNHTSTKTRIKSVLSIAGSDSGGGAGIQADQRTIHRHGLHACTAITAVTAQNTRTVTAWESVSPALLEAQIRTVLDDFEVAAIKIGMIGGATSARVIAKALRDGSIPIVLDPVLIASSGDALAKTDLLDALLAELAPLCRVITPNHDEAIALGKHLGLEQTTLSNPITLGQTLATHLGMAVLLKGGHITSEGSHHVVDRLFDGGDIRTWQQERLDVDGHGTGCTLSSAIACGLAHGLSLADACAQGIHDVHVGLRHSYPPGKGAVSVLHRPFKP